MASNTIPPAQLLADLEGQGFVFRPGLGGTLLVSPASKLSPQQRLAVKVFKSDFLALLAARSAAECPTCHKPLVDGHGDG